MKYVWYGLGGLATLGLLLTAVFFVWLNQPMKPYKIEPRGAFEIHWFHYGGLGAPGHEELQLWYHGERLAERPAYSSVSPTRDRIIYVEDALEPRKANSGFYYFDSRTGRKFRLRGYATFLNGTAEFPDEGIEIRDASPWSPDGTFAVVSYAELVGYKSWEKDALIVDLETGETKDAADLLGVAKQDGIIFRGWSDHATMLFTVGDERRELPISEALKK